MNAQHLAIEIYSHALANFKTSSRCRYVLDHISNSKILELIQEAILLDKTPITTREAIEFVLDYAEDCLEYQDCLEY